MQKPSQARSTITLGGSSLYRAVSAMHLDRVTHITSTKASISCALPFVKTVIKGGLRGGTVKSARGYLARWTSYLR